MDTVISLMGPPRNKFTNQQPTDKHLSNSIMLVVLAGPSINNLFIIFSAMHLWTCARIDLRFTRHQKISAGPASNPQYPDKALPFLT
jgi:hypothetical protein